MEKLGIYEQAIIIVTTDHGFNEDGKTHERATDTLELWIASNKNNAISGAIDAEQSSIAPAILELFGIDIAPYNFDGESLYSKAMPNPCLNASRYTCKGERSSIKAMQK